MQRPEQYFRPPPGAFPPPQQRPQEHFRPPVSALRPTPSEDVTSGMRQGGPGSDTTTPRASRENETLYLVQDMHKRIRLMADHHNELGSRIEGVEQGRPLSGSPSGDQQFQVMCNNHLQSVETQLESVQGQLQDLNVQLGRLTTSTPQKLDDLYVVLEKHVVSMQLATTTVSASTPHAQLAHGVASDDLQNIKSFICEDLPPRLVQLLRKELETFHLAVRADLDAGQHRQKAALLDVQESLLQQLTGLPTISHQTPGNKTAEAAEKNPSRPGMNNLLNYLAGANDAAFENTPVVQAQVSRASPPQAQGDIPDVVSATKPRPNGVAHGLSFPGMGEDYPEQMMISPSPSEEQMTTITPSRDNLERTPGHQLPWTPEAGNAKIIRRNSDIQRAYAKQTEEAAMVAASAELNAPLRLRCRNFLYGRMFEIPVVILILCNAAFLGIQTNYAAENPFGVAPQLFSVVEDFFFGFFWAELLMKFLVDPHFFLYGSERQWNYFDCLLMGSGTAQKILQIKSAGAYALRVLRAGRIMRIAPIIKTQPLFKELRTMIYGLRACLRGLFWAAGLLVSVMYLFGIVFLGAATNYIREAQPGDDVIVELNTYFPSMAVTLRSLFLSVSGGTDWINVASPLFDMDVTYGLAFLVYIWGVMFGLLNVITGVFVDVAMEAAQMDSGTIEQADAEQSAKLLMDARDIFEAVDDDNSGTIRLEEFQCHLDNPSVVGYFHALGMDMEEAQEFFLLQSVEGEVNIETFIQSCMKLLTGSSQERHAMVMVRLMYESQSSFRGQGLCMQHLQRGLDYLTQHVNALAAQSAFHTKQPSHSMV